MQKPITKRPPANISGSTLVMAAVFSAVFLIAGTGTIKLISRGNEMLTRDIKVVKSYWANEGALKIALRYLSRVRIPPEATISNLTAGLTDNNGEPFDINGYQPVIQIQPNTDQSYNVTVSTTVDNMRNRTSVTTNKFSTFSRWTWFENRTTPSSWWHGFVVDGNYHMNDIIQIAGDMIDEVHVTGIATTASHFENGYAGVEEYGIGLTVHDYSSFTHTYDWFHRRLPNYQGGVDKVSTDMLAPSEGAFDDGWNIEAKTHTGYGEYFVEMKDNGTVAILGRNGNNWDSITNEAVSDIKRDYRGIIVSNKTLHVAGKLEGKLTIVSHDDIILAGNILYSDVTPGQDPELSSTNVLGLVAEDCIIVPKDFDLYNGIHLDGDIRLNWLYDNSIEVYASLFCRTPKPGEAWGKKWHSLKDFNLTGSLLTETCEGTYVEEDGGWNGGFKINAKGDPRYLKNILTPPGIPDPKAEDLEMIAHWNDTDARSSSIDIPPTWVNTLEEM